MAEISPPPWMQGGTYPALNDRQALAALIGSEGVVDATTGAGDLRVTERGAGANMSVDVSSGRGWVLGDSAAFQGFYAVANDATVNLAIAASDATNPRKDIVIADVRDAFYTANDDWVLRVVTGTAEATPSEPALPDTALKLAVVDVAAGASSITNADITDTRAQAAVRGSGLTESVVFTASGTFDKADHPRARFARITVVGGGGGGVGNGNGNKTGGPGGGGGGAAVAYVSLSAMAASETVTVGSGGAGSSGLTTASNGGSSSFGSHAVAGGGEGGKAGGYGGPQGVGTTGDVLLSGTGGHPTSDLLSADGGLLPGGNGGNSPFGGGGRGGPIRSTDQPGEAGGNYGGGGGGGYRDSSVTTGGAGAPGVVIVELYA